MIFEEHDRDWHDLLALGLRRRDFLVMLAMAGLGTACGAAPEPPKPAASTSSASSAAPSPSGASSSASSSAAASSGAAAVEDRAPEVWWVRDVQMSSGWVLGAENAAAAAVGQQKSFFEQEGITPVMKPFVTGTDLPNMMAGGQVKVATGSGSLGISVVAAGVKARVVAGHCDIAGNQGLVVRKAANLAKPADLLGKKIGMTTGASITLGMRRFAKEQGLDFSKLTFVNGQPPDLVAAFGKGDIDAYAGWEPWLTNCEKFGAARWLTGNKRLFNGKEEPADYLFLNSYLVVLEDYLQKNPGTMAALLRGVKKGIDFLNTNLDKSVEILTEPMRIPKDDLKRMLQQVKFDMTVDDRMIRGMQDQVDFLLELKRIPRRLEPSEYMDVSLLEKTFPQFVKWHPK